MIEFPNLHASDTLQNVRMLNLIHGFWTWVEFFIFFIVKCSKIWNKIPYSYGPWKYSEK